VVGRERARDEKARQMCQMIPGFEKILVWGRVQEGKGDTLKTDERSKSRKRLETLSRDSNSGHLAVQNRAVMKGGGTYSSWGK